MAVVLEKLQQETYPIVKWVGGKRQLMFELLKNMPVNYNRYFEPFIGGGALFFELQPDNAYISDMNEELINLYQVVRDNVGELITDLQKHDISKEYFMEIRNIDRTEEYEDWSDVKKASRFIYLNRTCFNGMYRVNSKGEFNVPFGHYKNPRIVDENKLFHHIEVGTVNGEDGTPLKTRDGGVYKLEDLINDARKLAYDTLSSSDKINGKMSENEIINNTNSSINL